MKYLFNFWQLITSTMYSERHKTIEKMEGSEAHDLGHASKCVWELDKEA